MALWTPDKLVTLLAWYKTDAITGKSDGDPIYYWPDSSGNGHHLSASVNSNHDPAYAGPDTGNHSPTYKTNALGANPSAHFFAPSNQVQWVYLGNIQPDINIQSIFWISTGSLANGYATVVDSNYPAPGSFCGDPWGYKYISSYSAASITGGTGYVNGTVTDLVTDMPISYSDFQICDIICASATPFGAIGKASGAAWKGYIPEVILFSAQLGTADRQKVEGYLAWKYGLQENLPEDHPWEDAAPLSTSTYSDSVAESCSASSACILSTSTYSDVAESCSASSACILTVDVAPLPKRINMLNRRNMKILKGL